MKEHPLTLMQRILDFLDEIGRGDRDDDQPERAQRLAEELALARARIRAQRTEER